MNREKELRQVRTVCTDFQTREDGDGGRHLAGYFVVYNSIYEIAPGMTESVAPGAFSRSITGDIRALTNHDTTLVLGRTKAHTLELRDDAHGLFADILINPNDLDAMNTWERVQRGDVDQCSFGFEINSEETDFREDGSIHWTMTDLTLFEVSVCTFPAYKETNVSARSSERDALAGRRLDVWKAEQRAKLKGVQKNGTESPSAEKAD